MVTGGAGSSGRAVVRRLEAAGATDIFVPRSADYDLRTREGVAAALDDGAAGDRHPPGGRGRRHRRQPREPGPVLLRERGRWASSSWSRPGCAASRSSSRSGRSARTRSSRRCRSARTTCGTATRRRRTRRTAWPRRCCSSRARPTAQQYGFNVIHLIPVNLYGPGDNFDPASVPRHPGADQEVRRRPRAWRRPHRGLGHRQRLARVPLRRRRRRGHRPRRRALRRRGAGQPRRRAARSRSATLVELIVRLTGFEGEIRWDTTKPDGQPRRALDTSRAESGSGSRRGRRSRTGCAGRSSGTRVAPCRLPPARAPDLRPW